MSGHVFFEENGYFAWVHAGELANGKWEAFIFFERKSDHQKVDVMTMRHRLMHEFDSRDEAMSAAGTYALDAMQHGTTKL